MSLFISIPKKAKEVVSGLNIGSEVASFASLSATSFPSIFLWPGTQTSSTVAPLAIIAFVVFIALIC